MNRGILAEVKSIIVNTVGGNIVPDPLPDDFPLLGNLLDSLSITNVIVALEENFGIFFNDSDLSAEDFETTLSLVDLVSRKLCSKDSTLISTTDL